MPQSLYVFAVSLQEHPELLKHIMPGLRQEVKRYYPFMQLFLSASFREAGALPAVKTLSG